MARVLVADDDEASLRVAAAALRTAGHEPLLARNGEQCLQIAAENAPALVLLDVHMPDMDGLEVLRRLRADERTSGFAVVAFTAHAMKGDAERLLALGFDGYVGKPIRYREFLAQVSALIEVTNARNVPSGSAGPPGSVGSVGRDD